MSETTPFIEPLFDDLFSLNLPDLTDSLPAENKQPENSDGEKFVVFFLADDLFAVSAVKIAEIVRPLDFTPLPNSPEWLHGIANLRGEIVSVLNLSKICGQPRRAADSSKSKVIVLKAKNSVSRVAFPVDRLSEIITLNKNDIRPTEDSRFLGSAVYKTASVGLLDTEQLVSSLFLEK
jgi:purine-binding chemotaxis protein CheW